MTEEIIIDCGWYRNGWCGCETEDKKCEQIKLCKFKDDKLKQQLKRLEQENTLLKEQLLKKSETEQALQSTIEAIQDANKRISQCTEALRQINEIIKHYHLKVGGEVVGSETIYKIENKVKEILK